MNIKHIVIIIIVLAVLSSIPFFFGKKLEKSPAQKQEINSVDNSGQAPLTNEDNESLTQTTTQDQSQNQPASTAILKPNSTNSSEMEATLTPPTSTSNSAPQPISVAISQFSFQQNNITVKKGTKITWTNQDNSPHTVTSDTSAFESGTLGNGGTFSFTFNNVGAFAYHCAFHPSMRASIIVNQ